MREMSDNDLLQEFTDIADRIFPTILGLRANILGIFKHTELQLLVDKYEEECRHGRFLTEERYLMAKNIRNPLKGSSRFDVITTSFDTIYNMKFGESGSTSRDTDRAFANLPMAVKYIDMWPSIMSKDNIEYKNPSFGNKQN